MTRHIITAFAALGMAACTVHVAPPQSIAGAAPRAPVEVQILAFNDFHGNIETPPPIEVVGSNGQKERIVTGGASHLAAALAGLRVGHSNTITVSAGDTISASPLISANYLDEPTIDAMNLMHLEIGSVGNHEFDRGADELKRMQSGGCAKFTHRTPCAVEQFGGAKFRYLAANVFNGDGTTIFPATAIKRFPTSAGTITVGFIGETLKGTATLVTPSGVRGLTFKDEAETANALVPALKAEGADAIVLLIHQGGKTPQFRVGNGCDGLTGEILPIVRRLDPAISTIVSAHTHWAYVCRGAPASVGPGRLLTSAGKYGYFVTNLRLEFDPTTHRLISQDANNIIVGNGERGEDAAETDLVKRYAAAAAPIANRVIGHLTASAPNAEDDGESPAADLVADSMLAATRVPDNGGAQLALVNASGIRISLPAGDIKYANAFSMMPFGNNLVVMTLTGAQLKAALEQQYGGEPPPAGQRPHALASSAGFTYAVDLHRPAGNRVLEIRLNGNSIAPDARYRAVVSNYLASGGDGLSSFTAGTDIVDKDIIDLDALVEWIAPGRSPPIPNRIRLIGEH
ncbi:MAG TPA: bifunctional metallophosphatase/5'-nucleotidase [Sphingomicrobium sp.]|nr:bifunctional metallophosphatase/5'-nucleotidase [Sphingomicrobium sp.]